MKNILKISLIISLGFSAFSCEPDISEFPEDKMRPEDYFTSETELELWTNKFYNLLRDAGEVVGQNADDNIDNYLGALMLGERDASNENGWNWEDLRDINFYFAHSKNEKNEKFRAKYDGVAYFSRAYFYYKKVQRYGDVPLYDKVIDPKDKKALFQPRAERGIVMDTILADLDKAIKLLPSDHDPVRFTKWTALALKTRVALFEGTFRKYHNLPNADKYLNQAVQAGEEFINSSGYKLYGQGEQPYRDLFNDTSKKRDLTQEVILWRVYSKEANVTNSVQFDINNSRQSFTRRFMNHYLTKDGKSITDRPNWDKLSFVDEVKIEIQDLHKLF
ncbi:RagB/SusD family nutrient uptake outer membrane protein [Ornithobacterium rhinotracheale]|uniref:RagB/SusD family nutrient uptake outer membrane protein n=1 Tax=Ornithobacterium rhinotracheale TaxID=28251 RepID=UPI00403657AF